MAKPTPAEYVDQLKNATTAAEIEAIATALWDVLKIDESKRTNKLTPYNKAVDAAFPAETLIDGVNAYHRVKKDKTLWFRHLHHKFTNDRLEKAFDEYNQERSDKIESSMDSPAVVDADKFMECIEQCLNSDNIYEVSAGLIAASGRRAVEVWEIGTFTKTDDPYTVTFKGQAKRRDYDVPESKRLRYPIRLLIPAKQFLSAWRAFQKHQKVAEYKTTMTAYSAQLKADGYTPESIEAELRKKFHDIRGRSIDRAVKKTFGDSGALENLDSIADGHKTSSHVLRHAAVNMVTYRDVQSNAIGKKLKFAAEQLGHFVSGETSIRSVLTSIGYINFEVKGNVPMPTEIEETKSRAGNRQLRVNLEDRDKFNEIAAKLEAPNQQTAFHLMVNQWGRVAELERELATLRQGQQTAPTEDVTKDSEEMQPTLTAADVQQMIDNSMSQILEAVKGISTPALAPTEQPATVAPEPAAEPEPETPADHNPALVTDDGTDYNRKRKIDKRGELAMTDINNAFWAVVDYNEKQLDDSKKWYISERLLKDLAGGSIANIKRWFADHENEVMEHNERNQLDKNHNRKHGRNGVKISDVVKFERLRPAGTYHHR